MRLGRKKAEKLRQGDLETKGGRETGKLEGLESETGKLEGLESETQRQRKLNWETGRLEDWES